MTAIERGNKCSSRTKIQLGGASAVLACTVLLVVSFYQQSKAIKTGWLLKTTPIQYCNKTIDIVVQFLNGESSKKLQRHLHNFLASLLTRTKCNISLYIITDAVGKDIAGVIINDVKLAYNVILPTISYLNSSHILFQFPELIQAIYDLLITQDNTYYYNRWFFYTSVALHRLFPVNVTKTIMFDIDMELRADVQELYAYFDHMNTSHLIGLVREQQPVYAHVSWLYREMHKDTLVGDPPPYGFTGFNSGTKLMNFEAMRRSVVYNKYLDDIKSLRSLSIKYNFKGHLGDQDFYTLLSFEHMELFYTLPCQWNRQLCQWWRNEGFQRVFDSYFECELPYYVLHGNCGTPIPED